MLYYLNSVVNKLNEHASTTIRRQSCFSKAYGTLAQIDNMQGHKASPSNSQWIEAIQRFCVIKVS
jgi:hypothetical protein